MKRPGIDLGRDVDVLLGVVLGLTVNRHAKLTHFGGL